MKEHTKKQLKDQSGQTLVEFVLLLASITIISFGFLSVVNNSISERWENIANIILDDETQRLEIN